MWGAKKILEAPILLLEIDQRQCEEFGTTTGLGLIRGRMVPVPSVTTDGHPQKIPHIGWNALVLPLCRNNWEGTLLKEVTPSDAVYFVHSFMASPADPGDCIADGP